MQTEQKIKELELTDLDQVNGGMIWTRGTANGDVIDARGGTFRFLGFTFALNAAGGVSHW